MKVRCLCCGQERTQSRATRHGWTVKPAWFSYDGRGGVTLEGECPNCRRAVRRWERDGLCGVCGGLKPCMRRMRG